MALIMLIGFIGLAVPLAVASLQTSAQLSRNSRVYDTRLTEMYNSGSGIEVALHEILSDPTFDDDLTSGNPDKTIDVTVNEDPVTVTVTKIFASGMQGQGVVVEKTVSPTSTTAGFPEIFTYTLTIRNEGTQAVDLEQIRDYMPPGLIYDTGSTTGVTTDDPDVDDGPTIDTDYWWLNDPDSAEGSWGIVRGSDSITGSYTPALSNWETIPEYWESDPFVSGGVIPASTWSHRMRFQADTGGGKWRWRARLVRGGTPTDLFTSGEEFAPTSWSYDTESYAAPPITILTGDKIRLEIDVWSPAASAPQRLFEYRWGGNSGYRSRTTIPDLFVGDCSDDPARLTWDLSPDVQIEGQSEVTLSFNATGALNNGKYYNQVRARYDPWWVSGDVYVWTPYTAPIDVGGGTPKCGYDMDIFVTKEVTPPQAEPGVETEFTYTITIENTDSSTQYICRIEDLLPPGYVYVDGSAGDYPSNIDISEPNEDWMSTPERWRLRWDDLDGEGEGPPLTSISAGSSKTQVFRARATPQSGVDYFNEVNAIHTRTLDDGECDDDESGYGTGQGGASNSSQTTAPPLYDIQAVASDGTVLSRVLYWESSGQVEIMSWQEN